MWGKKTHYKGYEIYGWFTPEEKTWYQDFARKVQNGKIVEVGVFGGESFLSIEEICIENKNKLYGVDLWEKIGDIYPNQNIGNIRKSLTIARQRLEEIITQLGYQNIILKQMASRNAAKTFPNNDIDLIFIDADHRYSAVLNDLQSWLPKLKSNHWMLGHDYGRDDVKRAVHDFCNAKGYSIISSTNNTWQFQKTCLRFI
jgi:hypothetical protein